MRQISVGEWRIAYLAGAVVVDAVFVPGLLDSFRETLHKFLNLLQVSVFKVRKREAQVCLEQICTPTHAVCLKHSDIKHGIDAEEGEAFHYPVTECDYSPETTTVTIQLNCTRTLSHALSQYLQVLL